MESYDEFETVKKGAKIGVIGASVLAALIIGYSNTFNIESGERGVKTTFGKADEHPLTEGLNFKIPFIQSVERYDCRIQKRQEEARLFSADVQESKVEYALNYFLKPDGVVEVFKKYGRKKDLEEVLLEPEIAAALKDTMGKYKAEEMIAKREQIAKEILERMKRDMTEAKEPVVITDFTLKDIDFSDKFEGAVEEKVVAAQKALTEKNVVEQLKAKAEQQIVSAEAEAKQVTIKAKADAERITMQAEAESKAIALRGKALKDNPDVLRLQAIEKWSGAVPNFVAGEGGKMVPIFDLLQFQKAAQEAQKTR